MAPDVVVGLDAGTTSAKAVAIDADGAVVAEAASLPIATRHPEPGAAEQDPDDVRRALMQAGRDAIALAGAGRVAGLAIAAQSGSVVPIDPSGLSGPIVTWLDTRSAAVVAGWDPETAGLIRTTSGWSPSPGLGLATIAWLAARNRRRAAGPAARYAAVDDYLVHELTGRWITNPSNAAGMQLLDVARLEWDPNLCALAGVTADQLATIRPSGARLDPVDPGPAATLGLTAVTPLFAGGHDQACAALALGIVDPGRFMVSAGTAWVMTTVVEHGDVARLASSLNLGAHVVANRWLASTNLGAIGAMLDWWRQESGATHRELEADLAPGGQPTDPTFVPALHDADRTVWGRFTGAGPDAGDDSRAARTRAVVEAAAFEVRSALAGAGSLDPSPPLTLVGGAAANRALAQVVADVTGLPVVTPDGDSWPARGAARLAGEGLGRTAGPTPAGATVVPDPAAWAHHAPRYEVYRRLSGGEP